MSDIQDQEAEIAFAKKQVEKKNAILRLSADAQFNEIIEEYVKDEALRCLERSMDRNASDRDREDSLNQARATIYFKQYLSGVFQKGIKAEYDLPEMQQTLNELMFEDN